MKFAKAIAALLGGLSPVAVVGFLAVLHVSLDPATITGILAAAPFLACIITAVGPANKIDSAVDAAEHVAELPPVKAELDKVEKLPVVAEVLKDVRLTIPVPNPADAPTP